jgi:hypothetical protein
VFGRVGTAVAVAGLLAVMGGANPAAAAADPVVTFHVIAADGISMVADAYEKFAVYDTYGLGVDNGWIGLIGTSLSSPVVAAMIGLAGSPRRVADPAYAYHHKKAYTDITTGSNGYCENSLCNAGPGYDGPTGLGSPHRLKGL